MERIEPGPGCGTSWAPSGRDVSRPDNGDAAVNRVRLEAIVVLALIFGFIAFFGYSVIAR